MATKPTREQQKAADLLAEALALIASAVRLDGHSPARPGWKGVVDAVARASSAIPADEVVIRAVGRRVRDLGLPADTVELLTLMDAGMPPSQVLLLDDDAFRDLAARMEEELGGP